MQSGSSVRLLSIRNNLRHIAIADQCLGDILLHRVARGNLRPFKGFDVRKSRGKIVRCAVSQSGGNFDIGLLLRNGGRVRHRGGRHHRAGRSVSDQVPKAGGHVLCVARGDAPVVVSEKNEKPGMRIVRRDHQHRNLVGGSHCSFGA